MISTEQYSLPMYFDVQHPYDKELPPFARVFRNSIILHNINFTLLCQLGRQLHCQLEIRAISASCSQLPDKNGNRRSGYARYPALILCCPVIQSTAQWRNKQHRKIANEVNKNQMLRRNSSCLQALQDVIRGVVNSHAIAK